MKYWVYINDQVLPELYSAEELSSIPGFDANTLICPEFTPEGEEPQWTSAGELIGYVSEQPLEEPFQEDVSAAGYEETVPADAQEVYDASAEYTPEPLPTSYGKDAAYDAAAAEREQILIDKIEYLINEVADLKKDIASLNQAASMTMYGGAPVNDAKKNSPIIKDHMALKAFQSAPLIPLNENDIPEESISVSKEKSGEPIVLKASSDDINSDGSDSDDILESAIENTIRLKTIPAEITAPVAFDLASRETIEISSAEEEKPEEPAEKEADAPAEKPAAEGKKGEQPSEPLRQEEPAENKEPQIEEVEEPLPSESEILEIASVGNKEEESILKTFAQEKEDEEAKTKAVTEEVEALERDIEEIAEPIEDENLSLEPAFEQIATPAAEPVEPEPVVEEVPAAEEIVEPVEEAAEAVAEEEVVAQEPAPVVEEEINSLEALTTPPGGVANAAHQDVAAVENVDDKFLKTFTSSIEEVFLDQPTSIISDYVPPTIASQDNPLYEEDIVAAAGVQQAGQAGMADLKNQPAAGGENASVRQVRRIKPAAIKTVPMVAAGDPIGADYNTPNIDEAIAELNAPSPLVKGLKAFALMIVLLCAVLGFVAILSVMGILPKELSPVHYIMDKVSGPGVEETLDLQDSSKAAKAAVENPVVEEDPADLITKNIINTVKNYTFVDGSTLEGKIKAAHKSNADMILWSAEPSVDPAYYSVAVKLPPNNEGYSLTYRFSYNTSDGSLVPTTSESNNIMAVNPGGTPAR